VTKSLLVVAEVTMRLFLEFGLESVKSMLFLWIADLSNSGLIEFEKAAVALSVVFVVVVLVGRKSIPSILGRRGKLERLWNFLPL